MLVAAFSTVVAFGALAGLSGGVSGEHEAGGTHSMTVGVTGEKPESLPADTVWD
ncbi:hypothetical protein [Streptomyces sp. NPDC046979]|uniref:hypothetical protein n=1 Tax=Streptomyces sp. NPDC046979 TaxID=3154604 RepID=UPI0033FD2C6D